jgi:hypothetical protein
VYGKVVRETTRCTPTTSEPGGEGDVVRVIECRPLSRTKRWRLVESSRRPSSDTLIQAETRLEVADNTGARELLCIRVRAARAAATRASAT